jgi:hypothetical protein
VTPPGASIRLPARLDPLLPDLAAVLDPVEVVRLFEYRWPGPGPSPSIEGCALEHVRWSPGVECRATHRLTLSAVAGPSATTIGVVTATPAGVGHRLFTADPDLPGLAVVTDPEAMRRWFSDRLGRPIAACSVTPVSYRAGSRCVLRYRLSGGDPAPVYAKLLAADAFEGLASTLRSLDDRLVPPLVGIEPGWRLVAQGDGGDRSLASVVLDPARRDGLAELRLGGRLLARLHRRGGPAGRRRSLADDGEGLRGHLPALRCVSPQVAEQMLTAIDRLAGLAATAGAVAPAHGALRLDQVHLSARGPVLIDLDSFCWAEPARDLGNLLAYLRWRAIRRPGSAGAVAAVRDAVLAGYAEVAAAPLDTDRLRVFEAATALKIAGRRCRRLAVDEWEDLGALVSAALGLLGAPASGRAA